MQFTKYIVIFLMYMFFTIFIILMTLIHSHAKQSRIEDSLMNCDTSWIEANKKLLVNINKRLDSGLNPIIIVSAFNKNVKVLRKIIDLGADINSFDNNKFTPLMYAIGFNKKYIDFNSFLSTVPAGNMNIDIIKELIAKGADVNFHSKNNYTPLIIAIANERIDVLRELIIAGADVNAKADRNLLAFSAMTNKDVDIIIELKNNGAIASDRDPVLQAAVIHNENTDIIEKLIHIGFDVHERDQHNWTLLMNVAKYGKIAENIQELGSVDIHFSHSRMAASCAKAK